MRYNRFNHLRPDSREPFRLTFRMIRALASILLLGLFPAAIAAPEAAKPLPSTELLSVAVPTSVSGFTSPATSASGVMLLDLTSGEKIFGENADTPRPIGSLTKLMTAIIILENHSPDERVTIQDLGYIDGSTLNVTPGQVFTVRDLLKAMLIHSANNVAYSLAVFDSGSADAFVEKMNVRAQQLGLTNTHFQNPAGFDAPDNYGSPRDLAWLAAAAIKKPLIKQIVDTPSTVIVSADGQEFPLVTTNELLKSRVNVEGVKTGTTAAAGQCLITLFREGNRAYLLVLLGSSNRYNDASQMMRALIPSVL